MKFSIKDFFSKCYRKMRIWSHLLKKSLMKNFIFCAVCLFFVSPILLLSDLLAYNDLMFIVTRIEFTGTGKFFTLLIYDNTNEKLSNAYRKPNLPK